ncbi:hypothetical protein E2C01_000197 [Portunus trituberculatus]|uniref:Uncharacterized protein n=1 Tax=Portunus trituberculatus TaxID=210409 RepID=A0A5B7CJ07_PORTR|nr:hypothetical protein [Portunus trituberculatus]
MALSEEESPLIPRNALHHTPNIQVKAGPLLGIPLLLVVTSHDLSLLRRSLESIKATTLNSGLHLIATVADPTQPILDLLHQHSFTVHSYSTGPKSWLGRMLPELHLAENLQQVARKFKIKIPENVCRKDTISGEVKLLQTHANGSNIIISRPTLDDMAKNERKIMYIDNPYNPMHRRAVLNGGGGGGGECKEVEQLKEAMDYVMQTYPELKYLLLLETGLSLSPDFVRTMNSLEDPNKFHYILLKYRWNLENT